MSAEICCHDRLFEHNCYLKLKAGHQRTVSPSSDQYLLVDTNTLINEVDVSLMSGKFLSSEVAQRLRLQED